jgi:hypothetical protein
MHVRPHNNFNKAGYDVSVRARLELYWSVGQERILISVLWWG